jgi:hypothetical protein
MAFVRIAFFPGATAEHYAALAAELGPVETPAARILFVAGPDQDGWRVVQVWQTAADLEEFNRTTLLPALHRLGARGFPAPPQVVDFEAVDLA